MTDCVESQQGETGPEFDNRLRQGGVAGFLARRLLWIREDGEVAGLVFEKNREGVCLGTQPFSHLCS